MIDLFADALARYMSEQMPDYSDNHYKLVQKLTNDAGNYSIYSPKGQGLFEELKSFSKFHAFSYLRQNGQQGYVMNETGNKAGFADITVPFRFMLFTKSNPNIEAERFIAFLAANKNSFRYASKVSMLQISNLQISTQKEGIVSDEFTMTKQWIDLKLDVVAADFSIIFTKKTNCYVHCP